MGSFLKNLGPLARLFGPKLIGLTVGAINGYLVAKTGGAVALDPEKVTTILITTMGSATVAGKLAEWKFNPSGSSSPALVDNGVKLNVQVKAENKAVEDLSAGAEEDWSAKP